MDRAREAEALRAAALAVSGAGGDSVFAELVQALARLLGVPATMIGIFADGDRSCMRTLATWLDGRLIASFEYPLAGTPCAGMVGREFRYVGRGAAAEFAPGTLFQSKGIDGYSAYSLNAPDGVQLGLIVAMDRKPLPDASLVEPLLKIFAVRAVAEIERARAEAAITERKAADEALAASEAQYRAIFNASADALILWDSSLRRVDVNPAYERIYGWRRDEVVGRAYEDRVALPEYAQRRLELVRRSLAGETCHVELEAVRKSGERFTAEVTTIPFTHRGEPHVLAIARDVTARRTEQEMLRASEEQYRAIFNAAADALVLRDAEFRIVDVNPAYEAMSGYSRDEVLGRAQLVANPPEMEAQLRALHARALAGETIQLETVRVRKDGSRAEVELRGVPIRHRGAPHVLYIGRDISERRALEARLRQAQKMEALGQLTGGIAHDFNNLLASIMGYVVLAAERVGGADAKLASYFEQALASCRRARDLIAQMLTFSRGQRGELRALPLAAAVEQSLAMLRGTLPSTLELDTALDAAPTAMHDPVHIGQVVMNLLINARDATAGVGRVAVALRPTRLSAKAVCASCRKRFRGDFVELSVADSGPGIAPALIERIFEPFFTTKEVGRGSGMGLAMVHGIVHEHHGHIVLESAPGLGSRFRVLLPALSRGPAQEAGFSENRSSSRRQPLRGRVLVVDDEAPVAEFMRELLESWGMSARTATDPLAVPGHLARDPRAYDLVILDQTMPGMTGLRLARELLALRPGLPILLYTGHSDGLSPPDMAAAGIRALLHKPVEPDSLYGMLKAHLH